MAINYPTSLDNGTSLPYPSSTDTLSSPNLAGLSDNLNDAVIALETKLGIADANSQTPVVGNLLASTANGESSWSVPYPTSTIVGINDTQILTNKTISGANNTITGLSGANLAAQSITATQIANQTITATQIANATITATQIANNTITATQIANATITDTQIASGGVNYANLLSTIFSGQVLSQTNAGSGGGTMYYINLGGIKLLWVYCSTGMYAASGSTATCSVTFPTGFFTSIQLALPTAVNGSYGSHAAYDFYSQPSTTSATIYQYSNGQTTYPYLFVIGT